MLGYVLGVGVQVLAVGRRRGGLRAKKEQPGPAPCQTQMGLAGSNGSTTGHS